MGEQEVFPVFDVDRVEVMVSCPGASSEEVEKGLILAAEKAASALERVDEIQEPKKV